MEQIYVNIYKRPSGRMTMQALNSKEVAERAEQMRCKGGPHNNDPATRVACIRLNVQTLCIEGRYDE